ncbi:hypothetical protein LTR10_001554 [Elasticomyces elasticus]|nr:hypothetical protein LTR10_001554 [Elasticomyces elasticus]KAK4975058.1 hypothetical protein LTR42_004268 [Elasticomyces elasticus]
MATQIENISPDIVYACTRSRNAFLVKRNNTGGLQFSRDPLNLTNKHSRKYAGYCNPQAIGIRADGNTVEVVTKLPNRINKPATQLQLSSFSSSTPSRKLYKSVVNSTAKKGYRADLRAEAVARASAVKLSQAEKKDVKRELKLRGSKARKAAEAEAASSS